MPITSSAKKAHASSIRKRVFNLRRKRDLANAIKATRKLAAEGKAEGVEKSLTVAYKAVDKAAKSNVIKKNTAARIKSRLSKLATKKKEATK